MVLRGKHQVNAARQRTRDEFIAKISRGPEVKSVGVTTHGEGSPEIENWPLNSNSVNGFVASSEISTDPLKDEPGTRRDDEPMLIS
jgi:hypothetical protein